MDLDAKLIDKAKRDLSLRYSCCQPELWQHNDRFLIPVLSQPQPFSCISTSNHAAPPADSSAKQTDENNVIQPCHITSVDDHYFPISMPLLFGHIPLNMAPKSFLNNNSPLFPYNVHFVTHNIMDSSWPSDAETTFDTILL
jgi:hypothetical protein